MLHNLPVLVFDKICNVWWELGIEEPAFNVHTNSQEKSVLNPFILVKTNSED